MKFSALAALLVSASVAYAHSEIRAVFINGVDQGLGAGTYIRSPPSNSPVKDLTSKDMICNVANTAVPKTLEVSSGDVITFEWSHDNRNDDIIDPTHKGPLQVYVAPTASNGDGSVWVKVFSQGFTDDWATNKVIATKGHISITVPDLKAGEYLFRPEIVALHEADAAFNVNSARGAQFYMECVQFKVVSSGSVALPAGIDFLKDYTYADKGIVFSVYNQPGTDYVAPGGAVSSIAVAGQLGIAAVPAAGSKPTTTAVASTTAAVSTAASTTAVASSTAIPTTATPPAGTTISDSSPVAQPTTATSTSASVVTTAPVSSVVSTSRVAIPTSKMVTVTVKPSSSTAAPSASACPTTGTGSGAAVAKYYQCGGTNYTGSTTCVSGTTCTVQNPYYSQCL